jgi:hypothetical protein
MPVFTGITFFVAPQLAMGSFMGLVGEKGEEKRADGKIVQPAGTVKDKYR